MSIKSGFCAVIIMHRERSSQKHRTETDMNQCRSYLLSQVQKESQREIQPLGPGPAVTISCQTGAGEHEIASLVADILQEMESAENVPWTVFDRHLIEQVLKEHDFPESMARFLPEDRRNFVEEEIGDILGLHPPAWVIVPQIAETILHLANAGHVILVGRGAEFITAVMPNVFHVRLIAPLQNRIDRVRMTENLSEKEAARHIARTDRGRNRYAKAYFHHQVNDETLYHLVINTARIPYIGTAELIAEQARAYFQRAVE